MLLIGKRGCHVISSLGHCTVQQRPILRPTAPVFRRPAPKNATPPCRRNCCRATDLTCLFGSRGGALDAKTRPGRRKTFPRPRRRDGATSAEGAKAARERPTAKGGTWECDYLCDTYSADTFKVMLTHSARARQQLAAPPQGGVGFLTNRAASSKIKASATHPGTGRRPDECLPNGRVERWRSPIRRRLENPHRYRAPGPGMSLVVSRGRRLRYWRPVALAAAAAGGRLWPSVQPATRRSQSPWGWRPPLGQRPTCAGSRSSRR